MYNENKCVKKNNKIFLICNINVNVANYVYRAIVCSRDILIALYKTMCILEMINNVIIILRATCVYIHERRRDFLRSKSLNPRECITKRRVHVSFLTQTRTQCASYNNY